MYPSGQMQIIVRTGDDGTTSHLDGSWHGWRTSQGLVHLFWMQANRGEQSVSYTHSGLGSGRQSMCGFPMYPAGHRQIAIWFCGRHSARGAHVLW